MCRDLPGEKNLDVKVCQNRPKSSTKHRKGAAARIRNNLYINKLTGHCIKSRKDCTETHHCHREKGAAGSIHINFNFKGFVQGSDRNFEDLTGSLMVTPG